jgi:hypothetical protein
MKPRLAGRAVAFALLCLLATPFARAQGATDKHTKVSSAPANGKTTPVKSFATAVVPPLVISEFRLRGALGANDEFVEIYNTSASPHTVLSSDGSGGYGLAASDGSVRFFIPNGTIIPARGHYLGVNNTAVTGYSLASYAAGDNTYVTDIPDNTGIALFTTAVFANFSAATRIDSVGFSSDANPNASLFREGAGLPAKNPFDREDTLYRDLTSGFPKDTNDNGADFVYADTGNGAYVAGCSGLPVGFACAHLGTPGPENLSSPIFRGDTIKAMLLDATQSSANTPNRVRSLSPVSNGTAGTLSFRRRFVNNTGAPVTRLRFRVVDITTAPAPPGTADLHALSSTSVSVSGVNDPSTCPGGITPCTVTVQGTTLEGPANFQANGGAFNSTLAAGTVTLGTPLANGASISVQLLTGIQQTGTFRFFIIVEALP